MKKSKLKEWVVDVFIRVERMPLYKVIVAKIIYNFWGGFKGV
jgi:hypothetical protein|tara:strand:- start:300 stop:425 length:126 start_codon:yes stop_codon:yes gene_type:complete